MTNEIKEPDEVNIIEASNGRYFAFCFLFNLIFLIIFGIIYFNVLTLPLIIFGGIFCFIVFMLFINLKLKFKITINNFSIFVRKQQIFSINWKYIQNIEVFKEEIVFKPNIRSIGRTIEGYVINFYTNEYNRTIKLYCWTLGKYMLSRGGNMPFSLNMQKQLQIINAIKDFSHFLEISIMIDENTRKRELKCFPCNEFMYLRKGFERGL